MSDKMNNYKENMIFLCYNEIDESIRRQTGFYTYSKEAIERYATASKTFLENLPSGFGIEVKSDK